jgi:hypothetical protein
MPRFNKCQLLVERALWCLLCCVQLLRECNHGSRGNPTACEYSTGGNFLHAVLQYRSLVSSCSLRADSAASYSQVAVQQAGTIQLMCGWNRSLGVPCMLARPQTCSKLTNPNRAW